MSKQVIVKWQVDGSAKITANGKTVHLSPEQAAQVLQEALEAREKKASREFSFALLPKPRC